MSSERPPQDGLDDRPTLEMPVVKRPEKEQAKNIGEVTRPKFVDSEAEGMRVNEDASFTDEARGILAVFDGVSSSGQGDLAARTAKNELTIEHLEAVLADPASQGSHWERMAQVFMNPTRGVPCERDGVERAMRDMLKLMDDRVGAAGQHGASPQEHGSISTTAVVGKIWERSDSKHFLTLGNIGDSRAYLFREGKLIRLTHDQSFIQQLIEAHIIMNDQDVNQIVTTEQIGHAVASHPQLKRLHHTLNYHDQQFEKTPPELRLSPYKGLYTVESLRHFILQSVGNETILKSLGRPMKVEMITLEVERGDLLIAITDGIHDNLEDVVIERKAASFAHDPQGLAKALVDAADDHSLQGKPSSKPDDMTAAVMKIE